MPRYQDVHIQLSLQQCKATHVTPGDNLMAMDQPNFKLPHSYNFLVWVIQVLNRETSSRLDGSTWE